MDVDHQLPNCEHQPELHGFQGAASSSVLSKQCTVSPTFSRSLLGTPLRKRLLSCSSVQRDRLAGPASAGESSAADGARAARGAASAAAGTRHGTRAGSMR